MGKGKMADVMQEGGTEKGSHTIFGYGWSCSLGYCFLEQRDQDKVTDMVDSQAMVQSCMYCSRIEMKGRTQLLDPSQFLDARAKIDILECRAEMDVFP